ncbi:helix-turn-helix domain-containing protein [Lonepinella sp. MS14435]|uniref:helix-turn-helix domain-containing protein n=1 Tax=Lonepinella sp. MS14435 TaxID=3003618 RepID=UPI0036DC52FB
MKINDKIRLLREEHLYSQEQMAEKMHLSTNSYGKIERGETKLTLNKLEQIADIFDLDVVELIQNCDEKNIAYQVNHYGSNIFSSANNIKDILNENEKLNLIIAHKDETIKRQQEEITLLKEMLNLLKSQ